MNLQQVLPLDMISIDLDQSPPFPNYLIPSISFRLPIYALDDNLPGTSFSAILGVYVHSFFSSLHGRMICLSCPVHFLDLSN